MKRRTVSVVWLLLLLTLAYGCGGSARQRTLTASLAMLNAADAALTAFDEPHQEALVAKAADRDAAIAAVTTWRATRDEIRALVVTGLELVVVLAESDASLNPLQAIAADVKKRLKAAGIGGKP